MRTVGLPRSRKENENRRALIPNDIVKIKNPEYIYIEEGYGDVLGYCNDDYLKLGVNVCSLEEVLSKNVICDPKIGDADYINSLNNQIIFGWIHAVQNRNITDILLNNKLTAYAWEDMYEEGRHSFWRNNEIAGEAAIVHAYQCHGVFPYNTKVAVIGRGNIARGAIKTLNYMGADVYTYDRRTEKLFQKELPLYDVVVNAILWDTTRKDHIIYKEDLDRMKKNSMIIDISCDRNGGIETSIPTTIENPTYMVNGVRHYVVDHTPSLFYKSTTESLSEVFSRFIDLFIEECELDNEVLRKSLIVENGVIKDNRISEFQNR